MITNRRSSAIKFTAAAVSAVLLLCGCDNTPVQTVETAAVTGQPGNAVTLSGELLISDEADDAMPGYPVIVNDTEITASPESVICLSSSLSEIICELGYSGRLTGRGSYCDRPESVAALPDFGKPASPDLDAVLSSAPDLLITATSIPNKDIALLAESKVPVLYIPAPRSVEEYGRIYSALGMVFEGMFDGEERGKAVFSEIESALRLGGISLGNFIYVTEAGAVAGGDTFESSVLSLFGTNIAAGASGYIPYDSLTAEEQPGTVVLNSDVPISEITSDEVLGGLDAVREGRIITVDNSYFESPSGRITGIIDELREGGGSADET